MDDWPGCLVDIVLFNGWVTTCGPLSPVARERTVSTENSEPWPLPRGRVIGAKAFSMRLRARDARGTSFAEVRCRGPG